MKSKFLSLLVFIVFASGAFAQNDKTKSNNTTKSITDAIGSQMNMGDVMGSLVNGIKPSAFDLGSTGKTDLLNQLSGVPVTDYLKYGAIAGELAGALKGSSFLPGWASQKDGIMDQLTKAGSIADVAGGVSGLLGNLDPSSLTKGFKKKKSSITSALGILSLLK
ncbi:MAG TPA: hypothetical protein PKC91_12785 [Ignavibacteria bacterium]|nr:hypothetical protein [Ignavibacteria bacterium]